MSDRRVVGTRKGILIGTDVVPRTMTDELPAGHPVVLFDGVCNLCVGWVQFLIRRDPEGRFRFASLQSSAGERLLETHEVDGDRLDSVVVVEDGEWYVKSDAVLRAAAHLGGWYRLAAPLRFVPRRLRHAVYDFVAARRYGWFGKKDQCMVPTPDIEARFLEGGKRSVASEEEGR